LSESPNDHKKIMNISKQKLKIIGGGIIVLAAASLMLQPLLSYVAGLGRMISFIIAVILITYLITSIIVRLKGKNCSKDNGACASKGGADQPSDQGDVEV
jgi:hypothetical protein